MTKGELEKTNRQGKELAMLSTRLQHYSQFLEKRAGRDPIDALNGMDFSQLPAVLPGKVWRLVKEELETLISDVKRQIYKEAGSL